MKAHPDSVWIDSNDLAIVRNDCSDLACVTTDESMSCEADVEFVPVSALANIWSAGYVAGQKAINEGAAQRNLYATGEKS